MFHRPLFGELFHAPYKFVVSTLDPLEMHGLMYLSRLSVSSHIAQEGESIASLWQGFDCVVLFRFDA